MMPKRISPWVCVLVNQAAFPGLGTRLAGRRVGYLQMTVMLAGFCLSVGFVLWYFACGVRYLLQAPGMSEEAWHESYRRAAWAGRWGFGLCVTAWCWAGFSSISILRSPGDQTLPPHGGGCT
jgi:hypothetical protein